MNEGNITQVTTGEYDHPTSTHDNETVTREEVETHVTTGVYDSAYNSDETETDEVDDRVISIEEQINTSKIILNFPSIGLTEIDASPFDTMDNDQLRGFLRTASNNLEVVNKYLNDLLMSGSDDVIEQCSILKKHAKELGLPDEHNHDDISNRGELIIIATDILTHLGGTIEYIDAKFGTRLRADIKVVSENDDDKLGAMLEAELDLAKSTEEFTEEELYGDSNNSKEETENE